jgi:hypothetical protein
MLVLSYCFQLYIIYDFHLFSMILSIQSDMLNDYAWNWTL